MKTFLSFFSESLKKTDWRLVAFGGLALKSICLGIGFPESLMFIAVLASNGFEKFQSEKKRVENIQDIEDRIKSLENKFNATSLFKR